MKSLNLLIHSAWAWGFEKGHLNQWHTALGKKSKTATHSFTITTSINGLILGAKLLVGQFFRFHLCAIYKNSITEPWALFPHQSEAPSSMCVCARLRCACMCVCACVCVCVCVCVCMCAGVCLHTHVQKQCAHSTSVPPGLWGWPGSEQPAPRPPCSCSGQRPTAPGPPPVSPRGPTASLSPEWEEWGGHMNQATVCLCNNTSLK